MRCSCLVGEEGSAVQSIVLDRGCECGRIEWLSAFSRIG